MKLYFSIEPGFIAGKAREKLHQLCVYVLKYVLYANDAVIPVSARSVETLLALFKYSFTLFSY